MQTKQIALIPAYQPADVLPELVRRLSLAGFSVVTVDDGSGPSYGEIFQRVRPYAEVLSYEENRGKGEALKYGLDYLEKKCGAGDVIVTMDADGQHTVEDAVRLVRSAWQEPDGVTLGVRSFGKGTPLRSRMGNAFSCLAFRAASGVWLKDTQTGLRAFPAKLLPFLRKAAGSRYDYEMNVLMECARKGVAIHQVPISTIYLDGNKNSHFQTVRDSVLVMKNVFKFALSSMTGFVVDYGLYSLLTLVLGGLGTAVSVPISNIGARVVSAGVNFGINKHFVFKSKESVLKTGAQYFALAACILCGNTLLLSFLVSGLGANKYAAKLVTEVTFFGLSWLAQRFWIFRKKQEDGISGVPVCLPGRMSAASQGTVEKESTIL